MRALDYTGITIGACHVVGPADQPHTWLTRCTSCGAKSVKKTTSLSVMRRSGGYAHCNACRPRSFAHLADFTRPGCGGRKPAEEIDCGVINGDGANFQSTPLGLLQQDFYLGRLGSRG